MHLTATPLPTLRAATRRSIATTALGLMMMMMALLLAGLAQPALAAPNTTTYSKDGVSFEHPVGWKVTEDSVAQDATRLRSIDLEGPDEAVVTIMLSPFLKDQGIEAFAATIAKGRTDAEKAVGAIAQQLRYGPSTTAPITRNVAGQENKGVSQRFVISLLGQKLPHEARFFKAPLEGTTAIIMTQVADESAKAVEPGFTMALDTLRYRSTGKR
ncbi:hypothetical protein [Acidovorax sp.]|uniref:hypothetical protein n=1 Tax=Acidovorax sp. TaxID=1872122 RepID=UPI002ACE49FF|nr:hypothetical protein [Acidovorax sp.]MDZ7862974.1 hypothetical protein [Acidovorax sp.]